MRSKKVCHCLSRGLKYKWEAIGLNLRRSRIWPQHIWLAGVLQAWASGDLGIRTVGHGIMSSFVSLPMMLGQRAIHFNNSIKRKTKRENDGNPWSVKARLENLIKFHLLSERLRYITAELPSSPGKVNIVIICCQQTSQPARTHKRAQTHVAARFRELLLRWTPIDGGER